MAASTDAMIGCNKVISRGIVDKAFFVDNANRQPLFEVLRTFITHFLPFKREGEGRIQI